MADYANRTTLGDVFPERLRPLVEATADLSDRFRSAGHSLYLVGGSVRDAIVAGAGAEVVDRGQDLDFTTDARPEAIEAVVSGWADAVWTQGKRFGTIGCRRGRPEVRDHHPPGRGLPARLAQARRGLRRPGGGRPGPSGLHHQRHGPPLPDLELIDPFDGLVDLAEHRLRTPLDPRCRSPTTPCACSGRPGSSPGLELEPAHELVEAVRSDHHRLAIVSAERIRDELDKIVMVAVPSVALWFVVRTGLADEFLPELPGLALEQDPIHRHKDVLAHTLAVVDKTGPDRLLRLAALFHDVGKPKTRAFVDGGVTFHHHEVVGARMTRHRMQALRYPNDEVEVVTELVNLHLRFHTYRLGWTDRAVRRYVRDAGPLLDQLNELTRCDCTTRNANKARALARRMDELEAGSPTLRQQEELDAIRPDLDGSQVMDRARPPPGTRGGPGPGLPARAPDGRGTAGRGGGPQAPPTSGGPASPDAVPPGGQSSGQTGLGSPAANSSTIWWQTSSWNCTGGDFMK